MYEQWVEIKNFPGYLISTEGNVVKVTEHEVLQDIKGMLKEYGFVQISPDVPGFRPLAQSETAYGDAKVSLARDHDRVTRSVRQLVAEAFVEPPTEFCDTVIVLDGDRHNLNADNLAWRPRWFAWKFTNQNNCEIPDGYLNVGIINYDTREYYANVVECGKKEGLLYDDIWRSANTRARIYPTGSTFAFA